METQRLEDVYLGYRLANDHRLTLDQLGDYIAILDLNVRAKNAWERGNNSGNNADLERCDKVSERASAKAEGLAKKHGWKIIHPGLWWQIVDSKGRQIE